MNYANENNEPIKAIELSDKNTEVLIALENAKVLLDDVWNFLTSAHNDYSSKLFQNDFEDAAKRVNILCDYTDKAVSAAEDLGGMIEFNLTHINALKHAC